MAGVVDVAEMELALRNIACEATALRYRTGKWRKNGKGSLPKVVRFQLRAAARYLSSQTSSKRQPLYELLTMTFSPLTSGRQQVALRR